MPTRLATFDGKCSWAVGADGVQMPDAANKQPTGTVGLYELLYSLFTTQELERFVHFLPRGPELAQQFPSHPASTGELVWRVVQALERSGMVDADFWQRLLAERPGRGDDIEATRDAYRPPRRTAVTPHGPEHQRDGTRAESEFVIGRDLHVGGDIIVGGPRDGRLAPSIIAALLIAAIASAIVAIRIGTTDGNRREDTVVGSEDPPADATPDLPELYVEALKALRIGNSPVAAELLAQLCKSKPDFHEGRALLVTLSLTEVPDADPSHLRAHLDHLARSPTHAPWVHCLSEHGLVSANPISKVDLESTCPRQSTRK